MDGWWVTLPIQRSPKVGRRLVHEGTRFQVADSGARSVLFAGGRTSTDTNTGCFGARADAECTDPADIQLDNAGATFHTHSRAAGDSSFAQPIRRVRSEPCA